MLTSWPLRSSHNQFLLTGLSVCLCLGHNWSPPLQVLFQGWILSLDKAKKKERKGCQYNNLRGHQRVNKPWVCLEYERRKQEGQSSEIRMMGFHSLFSEPQTNSLKGLPKTLQKNSATWHNRQHLHQHVTVSHPADVSVLPSNSSSTPWWEVNKGQLQASKYEHHASSFQIRN